MTSSTRNPETHPERPFTWIHLGFVIIVLIAGIAFFFKLHEFMTTIKRDELAGFAFDPIMTYGFVAVGFLFLLAWAYLTGQFRDIEQPKYDMLERFDRQERQEARYLEHRASDANEDKDEEKEDER